VPGDTTAFCIFYQESCCYLFQSRKTTKSDDIGNSKGCLRVGLCKSNRYGKDKTVVIAMGRGKRQNDFTSDSTRFKGENTQLPDNKREKRSR
jgi:hypothetical protein